MASGGDEGGNSFQRTSATILNSIDNEANEHDEDETKQTNDNHDNGKRQAPRSTCSNNQKTNAIPGGEKQELNSPTVVNQATENAAGLPGLVAIRSSWSDIIVPSSTDEAYDDMGDERNSKDENKNLAPRSINHEELSDGETEVQSEFKLWWTVVLMSIIPLLLFLIRDANSSAFDLEPTDISLSRYHDRPRPSMVTQPTDDSSSAYYIRPRPSIVTQPTDDSSSAYYNGNLTPFVNHPTNISLSGYHGTEETVSFNDSLDVTATHQITTAISDTDRIYALVRSGRTVPVLQRDIINTCIGHIGLDEFPVMRSNDGGRSSNTCTIDSFMMNLMVAVLVYPHLPNSLIDSQHQIHLEIFTNLFLQLFLQNSMDDIRIDWFPRLGWYRSEQLQLDFLCQDFRLIHPLTHNHADQESLLSTYYGYVSECDTSFNRFYSMFYKAPMIYTNKEERMYGVSIVNSLSAVDIQYCFDQYFRCLQVSSSVIKSESTTCIPIRNTDPFLVLDAGPLLVSTQNIQNLLGSVIQVGEELYQIASYTVHRYSHYYSVIFLPQNNRSIIYDNNYGILPNHLSIYKLSHLFLNYSYCRDVCTIDYPDETISLIIMVKIERNDNNKKS